MTIQNSTHIRFAPMPQGRSALRRYPSSYERCSSSSASSSRATGVVQGMGCTKSLAELDREGEEEVVSRYCEKRRKWWWWWWGLDRDRAVCMHR
jgi:hypothetical protein